MSFFKTMARLSSAKKRKYGNSAKLSVKTEIRLSESASETIGPYGNHNNQSNNLECIKEEKLIYKILRRILFSFFYFRNKLNV